MKKTVCFIDSNYLNNSLSTIFGGRPRLNYNKLIDHLTNHDQNLLRTYFYDCKTYMSQVPTEDEMMRRTKQQKFHGYLQTLPQVECRFGRLKKSIDEQGNIHYEQKKVDVMFSIDLVKLATKHLVDRAVVVTGDLDMLPAIQVAKDEGVIVELWYARGDTHQDLLRGVDISHEIEATGFRDLIDFYVSNQNGYGGYSSGGYNSGYQTRRMMPQTSEPIRTMPRVPQPQKPYYSENTAVAAASSMHAGRYQTESVPSTESDSAR